MENTYVLLTDSVLTDDGAECVMYGIGIDPSVTVDPDLPREFRLITVQRRAMERLVWLFNEYDLSPVHFLDEMQIFVECGFCYPGDRTDAYQ